jgi:hypothetical protein
MLVCPEVPPTAWFPKVPAQGSQRQLRFATVELLGAGQVTKRVGGKAQPGAAVPPISYVLVCERVQGAVGSSLRVHELWRAAYEHVQTLASAPERRAYMARAIWSAAARAAT